MQRDKNLELNSLKEILPLLLLIFRGIESSPAKEDPKKSPMHELFLSAFVGNDDISRSVRILQGYCAMKPEPLLRRRLLWEGPRTRKLPGINAAFLQSLQQQHQPKFPLWRTLHEQLTRQSYVIQLVFEVGRDEFGKSKSDESVEDHLRELPEYPCDDVLGILQWTDWPDPAGARPVNSRLAVTITDEKGLCTRLKSMGHKFIREVIQEGYRFVHGNVVLGLTRYLQIPANLQEMENKITPKINNELPAFEALAPFDSENKWVLTARVEVMNGNDPEQMQKGIDELVAIKTEFEGCFEFQVMERNTFDTRVK